jgi:long-chain acyl-CoA synthetase
MNQPPLDTLPRLLAHNAMHHGAEIALREKQFGIWRSFTWDDYHTRTRLFTLGLRKLGVQRGEVIGLIGDNRPDWVMGEIAAHALGCRSLGIYRDALEDEVAYLLGHSGASIVFAEDEEQVDKLLAASDRLPGLRHIVFSDPRGIRKLEDPRLISAEALTKLGAGEDPSGYDALLSEQDPEAVAVLCTTSGTTARPKLAMLSSAALVRHCRSYLGADPKGPDDEYVSVLPLPWIMEQIYVLGWGLIARMKVNFVEEPETMMADFREVAPTFVLFAPRVWEQIAADVRARVMDASPLKQRMYALGMEKGLTALEHGRRSGLADHLLFRAARPAGLHEASFGRDGRGGAGPRYLPFLPGHGCAVAPALWPDGIAGRLHHPSRRCRGFRYRRRALR